MKMSHLFHDSSQLSSQIPFLIKGLDGLHMSLIGDKGATNTVTSYEVK